MTASPSNGGPYLAAEDSALLRKELAKYGGGRALEIGAGNGGNLIALSGKFKQVAGTDLVRPGMSDWRESGTDYLLADGAACFRDGTFDLVAVNPPYLPGGAVEDPAVDGGPGLVVAKALLSEALRVVKEDGSILLLLNDRARVLEFEGICLSRGFALKIIATRHVFFEELAVYEAAPMEPSLGLRSRPSGTG